MFDAARANRVVRVNGTVIAAAEIAAEMQNHPAPTPEIAWAEAARALSVRALLLQEAERRQIKDEAEELSPGKHETSDEAKIRALLEQAIRIEQPDDAACRAYYESHRDRFRSPDLFEASHILFAASPADAEASERARQRAEETIGELTGSPHLFPALARERSDCGSRDNGGHLGQIGRGQTVPEIETFLVALEEGQLCPVPVKSRFGVHVLLLHRRVQGTALPFEYVRDRVHDYLRERAWRRAIADYVGAVAARAHIEGFSFMKTGESAGA